MCSVNLALPEQRQPRHTSSHTHVNYHTTIEKQRRAIICLNLYMREWHDDEVLIITSSPVTGTQSSFSSSVRLASLFGCLLFNYRHRSMRKTGCLLALYLQTKKREGRPMSEAVSHFVYWHDGRSYAVPAGDFDRCPVWICIVHRNCKWTHEIEKNNGQ